MLLSRGKSECDLSPASSLERSNSVTILHSPSNFLVNSECDISTESDEERAPSTKKDPVRKHTLSSGEVTVIASHDSDPSQFNYSAEFEGDKRQRFVTVTNIFSQHSSASSSNDDSVATESSEPKLRLSDSQLLFNIEALKIAKRARDLQNTNTKTRKRIKPNFILNKLRKFKSLPNLNVIKNITMRRAKTRTGTKIVDFYAQK